MNIFNAGGAVHAFYDFHRTDYMPPAKLHNAIIRGFLKKHREYKDMPDLTKRFIQDIQFCWQYLFDLAMLADEYVFEPTLHEGGKKPDILASHQGRLYVVETKAFLPISSTIKRQVGRGRVQVREGVSFLRTRTQHKVEILGYTLAFRFSDRDEFPTPEWKLVTHYIPPAP